MEENRSSTNSEPVQKKPAIWANNLRAFAIHIVVVLLCAAVLVLTAQAYLFLGDTSVFVGIGVLIAVCLYVPLAYRFLPLLSKYNWLSVVYLPALLVLPFSLFYVLGFEDLASRAHALAAFVNLPSFLLVVAAYGFFGNAEPEIPQFFIYVQAFIPAVLMYAGLRLKMQRQGKAEDLPAEDLSAACEQAATSEVSAADDVKSYLEEKRKELEQS